MKAKSYETGEPHRIVIEPKDIDFEGRGVEIQVKGFKASPEEVDALNTHIYIEKYEGEVHILVWGSGDRNPTKFVLEPSTQDLADHDLFECVHCKKVFDIEDSFKHNDKLVCEECLAHFEETIKANCGHLVSIKEMIVHEGITCCPDCHDRIK